MSGLFSRLRGRRPPRLSVGAKVRVVNGAFTGFDGVVVQPGPGRIEVSVSLPSQEVLVELSDDQVELLSGSE